MINKCKHHLHYRFELILYLVFLQHNFEIILYLYFLLDFITQYKTWHNACCTGNPIFLDLESIFYAVNSPS